MNLDVATEIVGLVFQNTCIHVTVSCVACLVLLSESFINDNEPKF